MFSPAASVFGGVLAYVCTSRATCMLRFTLLAASWIAFRVSSLESYKQLDIVMVARHIFIMKKAREEARGCVGVVSCVIRLINISDQIFAQAIKVAQGQATQNLGLDLI